VRVAGQLLWSLAINVAALFVASIFISGIDYGSDFGTLILAGIVFGLVNFFIKPLVKLLACSNSVSKIDGKVLVVIAAMPTTTKCPSVVTRRRWARAEGQLAGSELYRRDGAACAGAK